jgi:hypothetical protein
MIKYLIKSIPRVIIFIIISIPVFSQSYKLSVGSNITSYAFTNSAGINPSFIRPASGLSFSLNREAQLTKNFIWDVGITYNQFNAVGDIQNIPFNYSTDFIGVNGGIGPILKLGKGMSLISKGNLSIVKMINGNQFLQNHYVDLSNDDQFNSIKALYGYSFELNKTVNPKLNVFVKYQHMDSYSFGSSTLNFIPSTLSIGIEIAQ